LQYAGQYLPCAQLYARPVTKTLTNFVVIANYIYDNPNSLALDLQGIWMGDRELAFWSGAALPDVSPASIGWDVIQIEMPTLAFVLSHPSVFGFSQAFLLQLTALATRCNYADYSLKHVTYPPKGLLPLPGKDIEFDDGCDAWTMVLNEATRLNPAFNEYHVYDTVRRPLSTRRRGRKR
jgi:carboxypeptidase D